MNAGFVLTTLMAVAIKTPDTTGYMKAGYAAIAILLLGYTLYLWIRARKLK